MTKAEKGLFFNALDLIIKNQISMSECGYVNVENSLDMRKDLNVMINSLVEKKGRKDIKPLSERSSEFAAEVSRLNHISNYKYDPIVVDFLSYWTESDKKGVMRFEKQPTWNISMRMDTFLKRKNRYNNGFKFNKQSKSTIISTQEAIRAFNS